MAKIHQNAHKFPIQWNGDITQVGKDQQNDNIPSNVSLINLIKSSQLSTICSDVSSLIIRKPLLQP